jgi:type II secretory pathway component PulF
LSVSSLRTADVILLADELTAMVRAGMPLPGGLRDAARTWNGGLADSARRLAKDLEQGVPLPEALQDSHGMPPEFRALVAGGLASGRIVEVLEAYSETSRKLLDLRESLVRGAMYPFMITVTGFTLLVGLLVGLMPMVGRTFEMFDLAFPRWFTAASKLHETASWWSWQIPVGVGIVVLAVWFNTRRSRGSMGGWLVRLPLTGDIVDDYQLATASQLLAMLLKAEIPLPAALTLMGDTLNSPRLRRGVEEAARAATAGTPASSAIMHNPDLPPLWRSLFFSSGGSAVELAARLGQVAEVYAYRASSRAEFLARVVPVVLVCVIGGGITFLYASALFMPLAELWNRLGEA